MYECVDRQTQTDTSTQTYTHTHCKHIYLGPCHIASRKLALTLTLSIFYNLN